MSFNLLLSTLFSFNDRTQLVFLYAYGKPKIDLRLY